jgi:uncharacterized protein YceK
MKKKMLRQSLIRPVLIVLVIYLSGCSSSNSDAPRTDQTHPPRYLLSHSTKAEADLFSCQSCHGLDLAGSGNPVPGCISCHDSGPPFSIHPLPYTDPADHGPAARADQLLCRGCHGNPLNDFAGGVVADPKLFNNPAGSCSAAACHPTARAHPTNWQGTNDDRDPSYDATHRTITLDTVNTSCVLCHKTNGPGFGSLPDAPSCFSANFTNSDGITTGCHAGGPGFNAPHDLPYTRPTPMALRLKRIWSPASSATVFPVRSNLRERLRRPAVRLSNAIRMPGPTRPTGRATMIRQSIMHQAIAVPDQRTLPVPFAIMS